MKKKKNNNNATTDPCLGRLITNMVYFKNHATTDPSLPWAPYIFEITNMVYF
jgi:hypothetical protein